MKNLTRRDVAESLVGATGLSREQADQLTGLVLDRMGLVMAQALKEHDEVELTLRNFGSFRVGSQTAGTGWDFKAGRPLQGRPRRRLHFRAARYLKDIIQND